MPNEIPAQDTVPPQDDPSQGRNAPLVIMAQYLKDLSFESPGAPGTVGTATELREGAVHVDVRSAPLGGPKYEVILKLRLEAMRHAKLAYLLELEYGGLVQVNDVPPEAVEPLLMVEAARMLFPYARAIVTDLTRDGGFAPVLINPIDFAALYRDVKRKTARAEELPDPIEAPIN